ncbi:MAG: hypothetical protein COV48_13555, partial [Elusimicrobia bacterium CG11_big_fil_rev_8_21_14_0_20_64_6]
LVLHLSREERRLVETLHLPENVESIDEVADRLQVIRGVNRDLAQFLSLLWEYRGFLRNGLVSGQVPLATRFAPWETFPDGQGTTGAQVVGYERGASQFVGLRYDNADGSSRFQGQGRDGRSGMIIAIDAAKRRTEALITYDADGKVGSALSEMYDGAALRRRERLNMGTGIVEAIEYKADGTVLKSKRQDTRTGEQFIEDLTRDDSRFNATQKDGRRETRFLKNADGSAPAISLRVEKVDTDGNFVLDHLVLQNGTYIVAKSAHVNQLLENGKKNLGWEVALKSLVEETDAKSRLRIGRALAKETVAALKMSDDNGRLSKPLGAFLAAEAKASGALIDPKDGAPVRFFINEKKNYLLIFTRRDGTKRILSGTFKHATEFDDKNTWGTSFGVTGEIIVDAAGNARQNDPKILTEYLADGSRLVWLPPSPVKYTPKTDLGWFGEREMWWTDEHEKTEFKVRRELALVEGIAEWKPGGKEWVSSKDTIDRVIEGTSVFGTGSRWVASVPGVKQVLGVAGDVASTLYTGVVSGGQMIAYEVSGNSDYLLEASAGYSRNPGVKLLMGGSEPDREKDPKAWRAWKDKMNREYLGRIGGEDNKFVLDVQAKERREKALAQQGITLRRAPQAYRDAMDAPVSDDERFDAMSDFGAGTYGRRLVEDGHEFWGAAMSFTESFSEGMMNPLMYVIPGIGRLAGAAGKVGLAAASPTVQVVARVAEFGLRGFQYALLGSVVGSFSLSALDNIGKISDYWGTEEAWVKGGEGMADLAFAGMMFKGFSDQRARSRLAEIRSLKDPSAPIDVKANIVETKGVETTVKAVEPVNVEAKTTGSGFKGETGNVKVEASPAPAAEAPVVKTAPPTMKARAGSLVKTFWSEMTRGGDAFSEKAREELRSQDVRSPTKAEANTAGTTGLDAKSIDIKAGEGVKAADVRAVEVKAVEVKAAEVVDTKAPKVKGVEARGPEVVDTKAVKAKGVEARGPEVSDARTSKVKGVEARGPEVV